MLDLNALAGRASAWQAAHKPDTGYTRGVFKLLAKTKLPKGTNLLTQAAAQYTGREEITPGLDLLKWKFLERRIAYSQLHRFSLDQSADCSSFWYVMFRIFFGINIGTWSEGMYWKLRGKAVGWESRRVGDVVLYNFKKFRNASHVSVMVKAPIAGVGGLIGHTTSVGNPFRFESDEYAAANRVGVYRALTEAQYQSLIV
jgi:hypothetical protein